MRRRYAVRAVLGYGAAALCVWLASRDGHGGWTAFVGVAAMVLAFFAVAVGAPEESAEQKARAAAKQQERVDAILWRYRREQAARERGKDTR